MSRYNYDTRVLQVHHSSSVTFLPLSLVFSYSVVIKSSDIISKSRIRIDGFIGINVTLSQETPTHPGNIPSSFPSSKVLDKKDGNE
jgi:hypothetical protein